MNPSKLEILLAIHHAFVAAASLDDKGRPDNAQANLTAIQKLIMEGLTKSTQTQTDDIPF